MTGIFYHCILHCFVICLSVIASPWKKKLDTLNAKLAPDRVDSRSMGDIGVTLAKYLSHTYQAQLGHTSRVPTMQPWQLAFPRVRSLVKKMTTTAMNNYLFQSFISSSCIVFSCTCYDIFTIIVYATYILSLAGLACRIRVCTITS